ncbi:MAG: sigma-54-dependent Fis family transcriptional regulator [Deltaproteobacteria bacterium]|nr:sigma-54-dependent Fis family transcriptional regulator [Deltaproteobacteria bacterium]MBM4322732.1 sigma-54-dependent Fis family transcriptional regulator [Deltaproteobacteria bacterium]
MDHQKVRILIVDDEFSVRDSLYNWFKVEGYHVDTAENGTEALRKLQEGPWDIALLDIKMPGMDGIELQKHIKRIDKTMVIIFITAYATVDTAVEAMKDGAFDYISKPVDPDKLSVLIRNAVNHRRLVAENIQLKQKVEELSLQDEIMGESPQIKKIQEMIEVVAQTDATVLIRGESGTGKELVAQAIHAKSNRRYFPIISINCGSLAEGILESELFGHEKGAFTGAQYKRKGKLEMANGGTIFFDEIGNISPKMQMDLLRVIETKQFTPIGSNKVINVDFRVIAATNTDLEKAVAEKNFREDFYYRLNVFSIPIPPLRERTADTPLLARYFLEKYAKSMNKKVTEISPEAMKVLTQYDWPGNIRELRNTIERALVVVGKKNRIEPEDLNLHALSKQDSTETDSLEDLERVHIQRILEKNDGNISKSAEMLKIDRVTLYNKIKKYNLQR